MKKILEKTKDIVFFIKLYPHPSSYEKSKTIVCTKSLKMLEDAFNNKPIPKPKCETTEIDDNIKLAQDLGITGTPSIVLPDGGLIPGYVDADSLIKLIVKP